MRIVTGNIILKKTIEFSLEVIRYAEELVSQKKLVIARQLLRAGTSTGANVHEAQNPGSKSDFIHKSKIAAKEIEKTRYWMIRCEESGAYPACNHLLAKLSEIEKIVAKINSLSKANDCQIVELVN